MNNSMNVCPQSNLKTIWGQGVEWGGDSIVAQCVKSPPVMQLYPVSASLSPSCSTSKIQLSTNEPRKAMKSI